MRVFTLQVSSDGECSKRFSLSVETDSSQLFDSFVKKEIWNRMRNIKAAAHLRDLTSLVAVGWKNRKHSEERWYFKETLLKYFRADEIPAKSEAIDVKLICAHFLLSVQIPAAFQRKNKKLCGAYSSLFQRIKRKALKRKSFYEAFCISVADFFCVFYFLLKIN